MSNTYDLYRNKFINLSDWNKKNLVDRLFLHGKYKDQLNKIKENLIEKNITLKELQKITNKNYFHYDNQEDIFNIYVVELFYK